MSATAAAGPLEDPAWAAVAADGTDPALLARAVARLHGHAPATVLAPFDDVASARAAWSGLRPEDDGAPIAHGPAGGSGRAGNAVAGSVRLAADPGRPPGEVQAPRRSGERSEGAAERQPAGPSLPGRPPPPSDVADVAGDVGPARAGLSAGAVDAARRAARAWVDLGVRVAVVGDPAYPARLVDGFPHGAPPPYVAWRGDVRVLRGRPAVAIVGARRATSYGTGVAAWLAGAAGDAGALVVSGGAVGVDAAAHEAALATPGGTAVVLGCGHAVPYPRPHAGPGRLFDRVVAAGGVVLSELEPHEPALPGRVRARNRLVAGLVDLLVVVEGSARSGTLRTATEAAERGVPVVAVPGDVGRPLSAAPHRLLAEGAAPVTCPDDLLELLALTAPEPTDAAADHGLPTALHAVLAEAWPRPRRVDQLVRASRLPVGAVLAALTGGRVRGVVVEGPDGHRLRRAPPGR